MKRKITKSEILMFKKLDEIKNIDVNQESRKIISDPKSYFEKYLKGIDHNLRALANLEIYLKIKEVDSTGVKGEERAEKDTSYFINKFTAIGYIDILNGFYSYSLDIINDMLENGNDMVLDLYNEKKISKETMQGVLTCIKEAHAMMLEDKESVIKAINQSKIERKRIEDRLNPGLQGFNDSPY